MSHKTPHNYFYIGAVSLSLLCVLSACGSGGSSSTQQAVPQPSSETSPEATSASLIKINQVGYLPAQAKIAIVPATSETSFELIDAQTEATVLSGTLSTQANWSVANDDVRRADFSSVVAPGRYRLKINGFNQSDIINIDEQSYSNLHDGALKAYYFNRASTNLPQQYAGKWARAMGHPDTKVLIHSSAASAQRPEGFEISSPKGWYDAGDYNKYIVNSGISTYTLLAAFTDFSALYQNADINIPESGDANPDILDEIKWNLDWMMTMQDPNDGGVYHKLTTLNFEGAVMPAKAINQRYVVQKSTAAALNFAAVMAKAGRVYSSVGSFDQLAQDYQEAAIRAFAWAQENPSVFYKQPSDVSTGEYGDDSLGDEFAWAAAELFLSTQDNDYLDIFNQHAYAQTLQQEPSWQNTMALGFMTLVAEGKSILPSESLQDARAWLISLADSFMTQHQNSAYGAAMQQSDFVWGSNAVALNKAMILLQAQRETNDNKYQHAAIGILDYILGKNPTDYSYVTGFGVKTPVDIHHRQSYSDSESAPVPGFVVGGPQPGKQDNCNYPSSLPAKTYLDDWCSYSTNEVTINWNAPLVYVLSGLRSNQ